MGAKTHLHDLAGTPRQQYRSLYVGPSGGGLRTRRTCLTPLRPGLCVAVQLDHCQVTQVKREETEGYTSVQQGVGEEKLKRCIKPELGHLAKSGAAPKMRLGEFRITPDAIVPAGESFDRKTGQSGRC